MYLIQIILSFIFFIYFFNITLILLIKHNDIKNFINKSLKENNKDNISDFKLRLISGLSAYLTIYFLFYPNQNLLNMNNLFINLMIGY